MSRKLWLILALITVALAAGCETEYKKAAISAVIREGPSLADGFLNPPLSARPRAYWVWINGNISLSQIRRDLEEAKDKGMGGFDIFDVRAINDPEGIVPAGPAFLGPESLEAIDYAVRQAGRLGLELGLISSSSWNAGGSWIEPKHGQMALFYSQVTVTGPVHFTQILPFPKVLEKCPKGADGLPVYYKEVAVLAFPKLVARNSGHKSQGTETQEKLITDASSVINLTSRLDEKGRLIWNVPAGEWVIMRLVCAHVGQHLYLPSPNSDGLIIDHFSAEATEMHFEYIAEKLRGQIGSFENTALKFLYLPSYEIASYGDTGLVWTPKLVEKFEKYRGYDMTPYLPILFGRTVQDKETTERFLYDFRKTLSDLIIECHYAKAKEVSNKYGLALCSEAGGPGPPLHNCPVESLSALGALDILRGEFWNKHTTRMVKEIACAAHIYGKKIVDMEAFTGWQHWQEGPFEYKPLADRAMCGGTNLFTLHTFPHNPPEAGRPGWAYHGGTHMGPTRVWWPMAKPFIDYLSRCSYLLQQGLFVGDVCYYYGDKAPNFVPDRYDHHPPDFVPQRRLDPSLGSGYDYDVTNTDVILNRMDVKDGRIVLPDGMSYELLVLPDQQDMPLTVLEKLEKMVTAGATVVGRKPTGVAGLADYQRRSEKVRKLADKLWGSCDGEKVKEHSYGKGKIIQGRTLRQILQERSIGTDFSFVGQDEETDLDYIHRRTDSEDIYFVVNKNMRAEQVDCVFRVAGKVPELWMPDTGEMRKCTVYDFVEGGTKVSLQLAPAGSVFVVFREKADTSSIKPDTTCVEAEPTAIEITGPWDMRFPYGWGAPPITVFDELISWTQHNDDGIKYFSGIATYRKEFDIGADMLGENKHLMLDLGRVRNMADVYLNGRHLGILWKEPFQVDVSRAAKVGKNWLVVEVANVWSNRIVGDTKLAKDKRYTRTNLPRALNSRHLPFVRWEEAPLLESGLLGPVRLISAKKSK